MCKANHRYKISNIDTTYHQIRFFSEAHIDAHFY